MNDKDNRDTQTGDPQPRFALTCFLPCFFYMYTTHVPTLLWCIWVPKIAPWARPRCWPWDSTASLRRCVVASLRHSTALDATGTPPLTGPAPSPPHALCERPRSRQASTTWVTGGVLEEIHRAKSESLNVRKLRIKLALLLNASKVVESQR